MNFGKSEVNLWRAFPEKVKYVRRASWILAKQKIELIVYLDHPLTVRNRMGTNTSKAAISCTAKNMFSLMIKIDSYYIIIYFIVAIV